MASLLQRNRFILKASGRNNVGCFAVMATLTESGSKRPEFEVAGSTFFRCRCFFACDHNVVWLDSTGKRPGLGDLFQGTY